MVIATILSPVARLVTLAPQQPCLCFSSSNFLLITSLKSSMMINWVLPWLRQMTIRIEVAKFFIFLGTSRPAANFFSRRKSVTDQTHFQVPPLLLSLLLRHRGQYTTSKAKAMAATQPFGGLTSASACSAAAHSHRRSVNGWQCSADQMRIEFSFRVKQSSAQATQFLLFHVVFLEEQQKMHPSSDPLTVQLSTGKQPLQFAF